MFSINKVEIMGRLVSTPTMNDADKSEISRTRVRTTNGGNTNVIPVIAFGTNARNLHSKGFFGDDIYLIGRIEMRKRQDEDGHDYHESSIVIDDFRIIPKYETKSAPVDYIDAVD